MAPQLSVARFPRSAVSPGPETSVWHFPPLAVSPKRAVGLHDVQRGVDQVLGTEGYLAHRRFDFLCFCVIRVLVSTSMLSSGDRYEKLGQEQVRTSR